jgi:hypothetical protein
MLDRELKTIELSTCFQTHDTYWDQKNFHNLILLRHTWGWKLLINTMFKIKLIEWGIPELSPIITLNSFQIIGLLIVQPQSQAPEVFNHFIHALKEEYQRVTWIIIHSDKKIPLTTHRANPRGTGNVHIKQLFRLLSHHGVNQRMRSSYHLATKSTQKIEAQVTKSLMPLPEFRRRPRNQTLHRGLSKRKISSKKCPDARNTTNKVTTKIERFKTRFTKENVQICINKLRDRQDIPAAIICSRRWA